MKSSVSREGTCSVHGTRYVESCGECRHLAGAPPAATTLVIEGPDHYRRVIVPQGVGLVGVYVGVDGVSVTFDGEEVQDADV